MSVESVTESSVETLVSKVGTLRAEIEKVIIGQHEVIEHILVSLFAGGHCLLQGVPGLAKTLMVRTLAQAVDLDFQRIQFTPDLMPSDIIGTEVLEEDLSTGKRSLTFLQGPVFTQILLADEINRTPPKTQAALLQAMQERTISYGGKTYTLEEPFFVLATQNPIEQSGTYPLPEAQLDRFLTFIRVEYPAEQEELEILAATTGKVTKQPDVVLNPEDIIQIQTLVRQVSISRELIGYVNRLIRASRPDGSPVEFVRQWVRWGAGPRAGQALILTAKARAFMQGRFAVILEDIEALVSTVLRHRILVNFKGEAEGHDADAVTKVLLDQVEKPKSPLH